MMSVLEGPDIFTVFLVIYREKDRVVTLTVRRLWCDVGS